MVILQSNEEVTVVERVWPHPNNWLTKAKLEISAPQKSILLNWIPSMQPTSALTNASVWSKIVTFQMSFFVL